MKKILTGSNSIQDVEEETIDDEKLLNIFDDLLTKIFQYESEKVMYTLKEPHEGFGYHWFFNVSTKMMENFSAGVEVEVIKEHDEDSYLCYVSGRDVIIKKNLLKDRVMH